MRASYSGVWGLVWCAALACGGSSVSDDDATGGSANGRSGANAGSEQASGGSAGERAEPETGGTEQTGGTEGAAGTQGSGASPSNGGRASPSSGGSGAALAVGGSLSIGGGVTGIGGTRPVPVGTGGRAGGSSSSAGATGIEVPEVDLPEDCTVMYRTSGGDYCDIELECSSGYTWVYCDTWESGHWSCYCESMNGYQDYELIGFSGGDACAYIASLCHDGAGAQTEFTGEPECALMYEELGSDYCSIQQECTQSADIAEGVSVVSRDYQYTWCENYDDAWTCTCDTRGSSLSFDFPASAAAADVCRDALGVCSAGAVAVEGPRECTRSYQSASPEWCDAQHDCTRTASVADTEIQVHEYMYTSCYLEAEDQWSCDCGIGNESMTFELSSSDAWSTCDEASATCVESFATGE